LFLVSVLEDSLKRMENIHESKEVVVENFERLSIFYDQVSKLPYLPYFPHLIDYCLFLQKL